jgi:curved DNA-binding protein CbpA
LVAQPDFYKILGVGPNASTDEIKSAYRNLVKKYHPDLYKTASGKKKGNEKLQQINEAYAALSDEERRRAYDATRAPKTAVVRKPAPARDRPVVRKKTTPVADRLRFFKAAFLTPAAWVIGAVFLVIVLDAVWSALQEERVAWILWAKTTIDPPERKSAAPAWADLGRYGSRVECAGTLKAQVAKDERDGRKTIMDEAGGALAITIHIKNEETLTKEFLQAKLKQNSRGSGPISDEESLKRQAQEEAKEFVRRNGLAKRETTYACKAVVLPKRESFLQRTLRSIEIF